MCNIIIVEDDALLAMDLAEMLTSAGHEVKGMAASAAIAYRLAEDTRPDIAIMDIRLEQGGNGVALAHEFHRRWLISSIIVTGLSIDSQLDGSAIVGWLTRPFHPQQLFFLIDKHSPPGTHPRAAA